MYWVKHPILCRSMASPGSMDLMVLLGGKEGRGLVLLAIEVSGKSYLLVQDSST